jgi:hypothetical protein
MKRFDAYFLTIFFTLVYIGLGIYFEEKGFVDGAGAWFGLAGAAGLIICLFIWPEIE